MHFVQLLACIGEQFADGGDEICGVVTNIRARQDKICIWTKTGANEAVQVHAAFVCGPLHVALCHCP